MDGGAGIQRDRAGPGVRAARVPQRALVVIARAAQGQEIAEGLGGAGGQFQGRAAVHGDAPRLSRAAAEGVAFGEGQCAVLDLGRARVAIVAAEREFAVAVLDQIGLARAIARFANGALVFAGGVLLHGQGLAFGNLNLAAAGERADGLVIFNGELGRGVALGETHGAVIGKGGAALKDKLARVDRGCARVGVRAGERELARAGLGQAARAADGPADGDFRGPARC